MSRIYVIKRNNVQIIISKHLPKEYHNNYHNLFNGQMKISFNNQYRSNVHL